MGPHISHTLKVPHGGLPTSKAIFALQDPEKKGKADSDLIYELDKSRANAIDDKSFCRLNS